MNSDIDFIIPWVDGNDPEWQKSFNSYAPKSAQIDDADESRFRDWGLLPYWFRGIEKFAPWVRKIHFITCGQVPQWLNLDAPKLHWVKHEDYIPKKYLPVFNVNPLELNLHKIAGLSDKFVYFNDDTFIIRPISEQRFFKNGLPCDCAVCNVLLPTRQGVMSHIMTNNMAIINEHFDKHKAIKQNLSKWFNLKYGPQQLRTLLLWPWPQFSILYEHHQPNAYLKSTYQEIWDLYGDQIEETSMTRFRSIANYSQWLMRDWRLVKGEFEPYNVAKDSHSCILGQDNLNAILRTIVHQQKSLFCINDGNISKDDAPKIKQQLLDAFNAILPEKSSFEK